MMVSMENPVVDISDEAIDPSAAQQQQQQQQQQHAAAAAAAVASAGGSAEAALAAPYQANHNHPASSIGGVVRGGGGVVERISGDPEGWKMSSNDLKISTSTNDLRSMRPKAMSTTSLQLSSITASSIENIDGGGAGNKKNALICGKDGG